MTMTAEETSPVEAVPGQPRGAAARPWHPIRTVVAGAFVLVPAHIVVVTGLLVLAATAAGDRLPAGSVVFAIGAWSLRFAMGTAGVLTGSIAGLAGAAKRLVDGFEDLLRSRMMALTTSEGDRLFPAVTTAGARDRYESLLDRMLEEMLGRVRVPGMVRRLLRRGLEQSLVDDFLADCERRGIASIGVTEVRNWAIATGLPYALRPLRGQIAVWRILSLGSAGLLFSIVLLLSLLGGAVPAFYVLAGVLGALGVAGLVAAQVGATTHRRPRQWRLGFAVAGTIIGAVPWVWSWLWRMEIGVAWIIVVPATLVAIGWGLRMALVSADRTA